MKTELILLILFVIIILTTLIFALIYFLVRTTRRHLNAKRQISEMQFRDVDKFVRQNRNSRFNESDVPIDIVIHKPTYPVSFMHTQFSPLEPKIFQMQTINPENHPSNPANIDETLFIPLPINVNAPRKFSYEESLLKLPINAPFNSATSNTMIYSANDSLDSKQSCEWRNTLDAHTPETPEKLNNKIKRVNGSPNLRIETLNIKPFIPKRSVSIKSPDNGKNNELVKSDDAGGDMHIIINDVNGIQVSSDTEIETPSVFRNAIPIRKGSLGGSSVSPTHVFKMLSRNFSKS